MERQAGTMPRYAIVTVVEAPQPEKAWEKVGGQLLNDNAAHIAYVGAPWLVPGDLVGEPVEYGTDAIRLQLNGKCVSLSPAD
jgi:hypothetical protein